MLRCGVLRPLYSSFGFLFLIQRRIIMKDLIKMLLSKSSRKGNRITKASSPTAPSSKSNESKCAYSFLIAIMVWAIVLSIIIIIGDLVAQLCGASDNTVRMGIVYVFAVIAATLISVIFKVKLFPKR